MNNDKRASETISDVKATADDVAERVNETATRASRNVSDFAHDAIRAADERRNTAARGLDSAADGLRESTARLPPRLGEYASRAAGALDDTADYVRERNVRDILSDVEGYIKDHPTSALIGALALGFFAGRMLMRARA